MFITETQEDYLRAIDKISQENDGPVKTSQIVESLQLSKSTVTQRLQELKKKGWVSQEKYGPVILTPLGKKIADNTTYKHRIIELFLCKILNMSDSEVHDEAHRLEHACSHKVIEKMETLLNNPSHCPHGSKLPKFHKNI